MPHTAKIFNNGGSQAVRLPAEYRFEDATEVYIRRDPVSGDVVLSSTPHSAWADFMALRKELGDADLADFLVDRAQPPAQARDPLDR